VRGGVGAAQGAGDVHGYGIYVWHIVADDEFDYWDFCCFDVAKVGAAGAGLEHSRYVIK
jgi:hypothetical protein